MEGYKSTAIILLFLFSCSEIEPEVKHDITGLWKTDYTDNQGYVHIIEFNLIQGETVTSDYNKYTLITNMSRDYTMDFKIAYFKKDSIFIEFELVNEYNLKRFEGKILSDNLISCNLYNKSCDDICYKFFLAELMLMK